MKHTFFPHIENGWIVFRQASIQKDYDAALESLEGEQIKLEFSKKRMSKSDKQRRYYWGCIVETLSEWNGESKDWWHEYLKWMFLKKKIHGLDGREIVTVGSTEALDTKECEGFHEKIRRWAAMEKAVDIKLPNEEAWWASFGVEYKRSE